VVLTLLVGAVGPAAGESLPHFDPHRNTWRGTHVVVVEGGKVVESWKGRPQGRRAPARGGRPVYPRSTSNGPGRAAVR